MRSAFVQVALCLALFGGNPAPATALGSEAFGPLKAELETRRDNDFGGTLDAAQKKRQKAVLRCLALVGEPYSSYANDMKAFASIARLLEKAYPEEMAAESGSGLRFLAASLFGDLDSRLEGDRYQLSSTLAKEVPGPAWRKGLRLQKAADAARDRPNPEDSLAVSGRNRAKAWALVEKGLRSARSGPVLPEPTMVFEENGTSISVQPTEIRWTWHTRSHRIDLDIYAGNPVTGKSIHMVLVMQATPGSTDLGIAGGTYYWNQGQASEAAFGLVSGTFTTTTLDLRGHLLEGSFVLGFTGPGDVALTGDLLATWNLAVIDD